MIINDILTVHIVVMKFDSFHEIGTTDPVVPPGGPMICRVEIVD
jgi:hypothetical protein